MIWKVTALGAIGSVVWLIGVVIFIIAIMHNIQNKNYIINILFSLAMLLITIGTYYNTRGTEIEEE